MVFIDGMSEGIVNTLAILVIIAIVAALYLVYEGENQKPTRMAFAPDERVDECYSYNTGSCGYDLDECISGKFYACVKTIRPFYVLKKG